MTTLAESLQAGAFERVRYVDPWGRHIVRLDVLVELLPEWVDILAHDFREHTVEDVDPSDVGAQVWDTHEWPALSQFGLGRNIHLPSVFSLGDTVYVVLMDSEVYPDDGGGAAIVACPLVVDVDGVQLANIDLPDQMFHVQDPQYLLKLRERAMRAHPPISLNLLHGAGFDLETVKVVDGMAWEGERPGCTTFRARPINDLDMVSANLLCGEDGPRVFLTELPRVVSDLDDAYESLCSILPEEFDTAFRQGSWWFVPATDDEVGEHGRPPGKYRRSTKIKARAITRRDLALRNARRKPGERPPMSEGFFEGNFALLHPESDHFVSELVEGDDGGLYARGLLRHRRHAHEPQVLDGWHRVYPNGQVRSWSMPAPFHH